MTEKDPLQWCSEFRKDKVKNRLARLVYQSDMEVLRRQSKAEIERDVEEAFKIVLVARHPGGGLIGTEPHFPFPKKG